MWNELEGTEAGALKYAEFSSAIKKARRASVSRDYNAGDDPSKLPLGRASPKKARKVAKGDGWRWVKLGAAALFVFLVSAYANMHFSDLAAKLPLVGSMGVYASYVAAALLRDCALSLTPYTPPPRYVGILLGLLNAVVACSQHYTAVVPLFVLTVAGVGASCMASMSAGAIGGALATADCVDAAEGEARPPFSRCVGADGLWVAEGCVCLLDGADDACYEIELGTATCEEVASGALDFPLFLGAVLPAVMSIAMFTAWALAACGAKTVLGHSRLWKMVTCQKAEMSPEKMAKLNARRRAAAARKGRKGGASATPGRGKSRGRPGQASVARSGSMKRASVTDSGMLVWAKVSRTRRFLAGAPLTPPPSPSTSSRRTCPARGRRRCRSFASSTRTSREASTATSSPPPSRSSPFQSRTRSSRSCGRRPTRTGPGRSSTRSSQRC